MGGAIQTSDDAAESSSGRLLAQRLAETLPFHVAVAIYTVVVIGIAAAFGHASLAVHQSYLSRFGLVYLFTLPLFSAVTVATLKIARPGRQHAVLQGLAPPDAAHFASGLGMLLSLMIMLGSFTAFKTLMPEIRQGFPYDAIQAEIDRWLHFGHDPGSVLAALHLPPLLHRAMILNYSIGWSVLVFIPPFFIATARIGAKIRLRYFISVMALWVVAGNVFAFAFLSAGPAFYGNVTGDHARFAALLETVRGSGAVFGTPAAFQAYLWDNYSSGRAALGSGISAFPSLHVGLAMINALFLREFDRRLGLSGFLYVGIITLSSVWLGWHYAIDGYVSIVLAIVVHAVIRRAMWQHKVLRSGAQTFP